VWAVWRALPRWAQNWLLTGLVLAVTLAGSWAAAPLWDHPAHH
jgi:hypothetical protein